MEQVSNTGVGSPRVLCALLSSSVQRASWLCVKAQSQGQDSRMLPARLGWSRLAWGDGAGVWNSVIQQIFTKRLFCRAGSQTAGRALVRGGGGSCFGKKERAQGSVGCFGLVFLMYSWIYKTLKNFIGTSYYFGIKYFFNIYF